MKRTAGQRRSHEIEETLATANNLLVACIRCDTSLEDFLETKDLISELRDIRHQMLHDMSYDPAARVQAIERRIVERRATVFTSTTSNPSQTPREGLQTDPLPYQT